MSIARYLGKELEGYYLFYNLTLVIVIGFYWDL